MWSQKNLIWAYKTVAEDGLFYLNMNFYISMIALITNSKLRVHFYDIEFIWCDRINSSHAKLDHATVGIPMRLFDAYAHPFWMKRTQLIAIIGCFVSQLIFCLIKSIR